MIKVKRLNEKEFVVNSELILYIEETPDTVITLTTGQKVVVTESADEIIEMIVGYKGRIEEFKRKE